MIRTQIQLTEEQARLLHESARPWDTSDIISNKLGLSQLY